VPTSKGTIQGYNGVATVDKKHQVIVDAHAFGHGQEHHTLKPVLLKVRSHSEKLKIRKDLFKSSIIISADTGFSNESNNEYLHKNKVNAYIPNNAFRSRDPKFADQKENLNYHIGDINRYWLS
jgi:Transposase DDE domain